MRGTGEARWAIELAPNNAPHQAPAYRTLLATLCSWGRSQHVFQRIDRISDHFVKYKKSI